MALFLGSFPNKLDKKGRVSVPAPFRAALAPAQAFVAFPSPTSTGLEAWDQARMERLASSTEDLPLFSPGQEDLAGWIFPRAHLLPFDPEGRIALPEKLIEFAGIADTVLFVGRGPSFMLWEPDRFAAYDANASQRLRDNPPNITLRRDGEKP